MNEIEKWFGKIFLQFFFNIVQYSFNFFLPVFSVKRKAKRIQSTIDFFSSGKAMRVEWAKVNEYDGRRNVRQRDEFFKVSFFSRLCWEYFVSWLFIKFHLQYVKRQFEVDKFDMSYLCLRADSNFRFSSKFPPVFFFHLSCDASSHAVKHSDSFVVVSLLHTSIKWMNESLSFSLIFFFSPDSKTFR